MKKTSILVFTALLLFAITQACKGPQGDIGPQGVPGVQGEKGAQGPIGPANIIYSEWLKVTFTGSGSSWKANILAPKITQEILDRGIIKIYLQIAGSVYELPINTGISIIYQELSKGSIEILSNLNQSNRSWRYVIIPGGTGARKASVDYSDYQAVKKAYNIPN